MCLVGVPLKLEFQCRGLRRTLGCLHVTDTLGPYPVAMKRSLRIEVVPCVLLAEGALRAEDDTRSVGLEPESARHPTRTECRLAWHGFGNIIDLAFTGIIKIPRYLVQNSRSIYYSAGLGRFAP